MQHSTNQSMKTILNGKQIYQLKKKSIEPKSSEQK